MALMFGIDKRAGSILASTSDICPGDARPNAHCMPLLIAGVARPGWMCVKWDAGAMTSEDAQEPFTEVS